MEQNTASLWLEREDKQPRAHQSSREIEQAKKVNLASIQAFYKAQDEAKLAQVRKELKTLI